MRFYYLTLTLFLQAIYLVAQPASEVKLSSEQIAVIENQGAIGIQSVFEDLEFQIQDLPLVEAFASEVVSSQITSSSNVQKIIEVASYVNIALAEIASAENINSSYVIEYASAGTARGSIASTQIGNKVQLESVKSASEGSILGAIQFSLNNKTNIDKSVSAAASGYVAGAIEAAKDRDLNIIKTVQASSSGLIIGAINTTLQNNIEIYETLSSTCEGIAEAAVEASVREQLDLITQVTAASIGAGKSAVKAANTLSLEVRQTQESIYKGLRRGTSDSIPGKGNNIRIIITPLEGINSSEIIQKIEKGIFEGGVQSGYMPTIETPYEFDQSVIQISPTN